MYSDIGNAHRPIMRTNLPTAFRFQITIHNRFRKKRFVMRQNKTTCEMSAVAPSPLQSNEYVVTLHKNKGKGEAVYLSDVYKKRRRKRKKKK